MSKAEAEGSLGASSSRAYAWIRPVARKFILARDPGSAAIQSVVLQFLTVLANLITGVVTARLLGAEGRGVYAAATSWPTVLGAIAVAGTMDAVLVAIRRRPQQALAIVAWASAAMMVCATVLTAITYVAMPALLGPRHAQNLQIARISLLLTHIIASGAIWRYVFAGRGQFLLANLATFLPHLIHATVITALALTGRLTVGTAIGALGAGVIGVQLVLLPYILREVRAPWKDIWASGVALMKFALRAAPADLTLICCDWSDRLLLIFLLAPRELGLYAVAYGFSRTVAIITPTNGVLLAALTRTNLLEAKQLHDLSVRLCLAILAVGTVVAFILSEPLIRLFYGESFVAAVTTFKILAAQAAAARVGGVTAQFYLACNRPGLLSAFSLINVVASAVLMIVLTPTFGPAGAAFGLLAGSLLRLALLWRGFPLHLGLAAPRLWPSLSDIETARAAFRA